MKIEKLNDHEIRCTLTREDLAGRHLKLSELAYGSEKTKDLFRDMMQQAAFQYGFEAEDTPLMIEAVPVNTDCIVVSVTKVQDPEELDTRFSKFAPSVGSSNAENSDEEEPDYSDDESDTYTDVPSDIDTPAPQPDSSNEDMMQMIHNAADMLSSVRGELRAADDKKTISREAPDEKPHTSLRYYEFSTIHDLIDLTDLIQSDSALVNTLYKRKDNGQYLLMVRQDSLSPSEFSRLCSEISEYGSPIKITRARLPFIDEFCEDLIQGNALQTLKS